MYTKEGIPQQGAGSKYVQLPPPIKIGQFSCGLKTPQDIFQI
jgi:hypothetical protein